jgi:hypothetical protein
LDDRYPPTPNSKTAGRITTSGSAQIATIIADRPHLADLDPTVIVADSESRLSPAGNPLAAPARNSTSGAEWLIADSSNQSVRPDHTTIQLPSVAIKIASQAESMRMRPFFAIYDPSEVRAGVAGGNVVKLAPLDFRACGVVWRLTRN